jgi:uncharacterized protein (DUF433 family)
VRVDATESPIVSRNPDVMGGAPVFRDTRVPVQTLLDYLQAGESIDDFLAGFPSVTREQVVGFLEAAKDSLLETTA